LSKYTCHNIKYNGHILIQIDFSKVLLENHIKRHYKVYVDIQVYDNVWSLRVGANLCKICIVFVLYLGDLNNRLNTVIGLYCPKLESVFPKSYVVIVFKDLVLDLVVLFVDIDGIVHHHRLSFLCISIKTSR